GRKLEERDRRKHHREWPRRAGAGSQRRSRRRDALLSGAATVGQASSLSRRCTDGNSLASWSKCPHPALSRSVAPLPFHQDGERDQRVRGKSNFKLLGAALCICDWRSPVKIAHHASQAFNPSPNSSLQKRRLRSISPFWYSCSASLRS